MKGEKTMRKRIALPAAAFLLVTASFCGCGVDENIDIQVRPDAAAVAESNITEKLPVPEATEKTEVISEVTEETSAVSSEETEPDIETAISEVEQTVVQNNTEAPETEASYTEKCETTPEVQTQCDTTCPESEIEPTYINGILIANKTYPLPESYNPGRLTTETLEAYNKMYSDACNEGLSIWIQSGFRSYSDQDRIYNGYVARDGKEAADTYSARPGHSEHQTGLAFDLNTIDSSFAYTAEGQWVAENCHKYGFIVRYPQSKESITGYKYEPWHLRYLGVETATKVYESGLCLEEYLGITSQYNY